MKNYVEVVDLIVKEEVDMVYLAVFIYIKVRECNFNIKFLVIFINRISGRFWYISVIIVDIIKNIKIIEDLKGKCFVFVSLFFIFGFFIFMNGL